MGWEYLYLHQDVVAAVRIRGAGWIDGPQALECIILELDDAAAELGVLAHEGFEEVVHLAVRGDVVLLEANREETPGGPGFAGESISVSKPDCSR